MHDAGKIFGGFALFLAVVALPFYYTGAFGEPGHRPDPKAPADSKACVEPKAYMKARHMELLDRWRDSAVREGDRTYVAEDGKAHDISLSNGCMKCHDDKQKFCDECHNYLGVSPNCWDCHVEPKRK